MGMFSIGRFADATGLTVKALRHYDEIGLLRPRGSIPTAATATTTPAQIEDAVTIRRLRALELPLDEIHDSLTPTPARCTIGSSRTVTASRRRCGTSTAS